MITAIKILYQLIYHQTRYIILTFNITEINIMFEKMKNLARIGLLVILIHLNVQLNFACFCCGGCTGSGGSDTSGIFGIDDKRMAMSRSGLR